MKSIFIIFFHTLVLSDSRHMNVNFDTTLRINKNEMLSSARISHGEPANIEEFPHMLAMIVVPSGGFMCGASIIHKLWALTAAHCISFVPPHEINFRGGSTKRLSGGLIFSADFFLIHPQYNSIKLEFDVGIVKVSDATPMDGINIQAIALPSNCNKLCCNVCDGTKVTVSGWGLDENNVIPENLAQLTSPVHDHDDCAKLWLNTVYQLKVGPDYFCQQNFGGRGTCRGDSGSPVIVREGKNRTQVGLVSFGTQICGDSNSLPSGLTRIEFSPIRNWIRETIGV